MDEPKEDSTRGKAFMRPLTYKGDVALSTWADARALAVIAEYMEKDVGPPKNIASLVRYAVERLAETIDDYSEVGFKHTAQAHTILTEKYGLKYDTRLGGKNKLHNLILSDRKETERIEFVRNARRVATIRDTQTQRGDLSEGITDDELETREKDSLSHDMNEMDAFLDGLRQK